MSAVSAWVAEGLVASTLLMAAVLLVRGPVRRLFGVQLGYALWALPLLRLLLPPLPGSWGAASQLPIERAGQAATVLFSAPVPLAGADLPISSALSGLVTLAWALGAVGFFLVNLVRHLRFCRRVMEQAESVEHGGGLRIVTSAAAGGPLAFGVWQRTIALPLDFTERFGPDEQRLALAHEAGHHRRGDLLANWAALGVLALHWFNPVAWCAFRVFRADQELANDARVLADVSVADRHVYARALVKATQGGPLSAACHFRSVFNLKRRLKMLTTARTSPRRLAVGTAAVSLLVAGGLGATASGRQAALVAAGGGSHQLRTIVVNREASGAPVLVVRRSGVAAGEALPDGVVLPRDFTLASACRDQRDGKPITYVIRGSGGDSDYTVTCTAGTSQVAAQAASLERDAYKQGLSGLRGERRLIATQTQPPLPEAMRKDALATVDLSIAELERDLAQAD